MTPDFDLKGFLAVEVGRVDTALERALTHADLDRLSPEVRAAIEHGVRSGGKRLRPILCVQSWAAAGGGDPGSSEAAYDLGASLEMIHAYSLMHDDLPCMDDADLRRGESTTHRVHGVDAAMRGGVALIPLAAAHALRSARALGCDGERAARVARRLLQAAGNGGMVGGQGLDLLGEDRNLSSAELDTLHAHKTGALLTASLAMGADAAGAAPEVQNALETFGRHIGLAFQIADDVLDATATAAELGKTPSDADLGKSTYVALHGLDEARRRGEAEIEAALAALDGVGVSAPPLRALAEYVVRRER